MTKCYLSYHNITSSLGFDTTTVFNHLKNEKSGIQIVEDPTRFYKPFFGAVIPTEILDSKFKILDSKNKFTRLEKMLILSLSKTITASNIEINNRVGLIISTTKGNIDVLEHQNQFPKERTYLSELGKIIKNYFGFENEPLVISNACVSGILSVAIAKRYLQEGVYDHVFVVAGDIISDFVLSGFNSFHALSDAPCQPFDQNRTGINLGEAAVSVLVTSSNDYLSDDTVEILGEGSCNDANHISGPSRTGEGLYRSVKSALKEAHISTNEIDYLSSHGTATLFNDEMEAIAFNRVGLNQTPLNSLKGYFGHTLGASGLLETLIGMQSLHQNTLIASAGFKTLGVSQPLHIITETTQQKLRTFLKTASGFGGCNTAVLFRKVS
ncbi:beta-ketoacyl synthase N-terminal-like domain-containing protein [Gelidibacter sp.]|uniref:beta-ketoacyl synthase N-terminal-like domain-containing protein n=1 Tax=Gelidibacter sp. TaxID=2018083 RepID=UPI002BCFAA79|nr:beta-ketoacyl synthase N-terminal-like domain-containing protein [Gelidibacter sp.]HUH28231.1 beta-ketoacyl synthase N-terminal-like domain-containing protein [Gelidibacter sp.]